MIKTVAVIGTGVMGRQIAEQCILNEINVRMVDVSKNALESAISYLENSLSKRLGEDQAKRLKNTYLQIYSTSLEDAIDENVDLIIECIIENIDEKRKLFKTLDAIAPQNVIFASNTSSFRITLLSESCKAERRTRFLGLHFFNPLSVLRLVEIIPTPWTENTVISEVKSFAERIGRIPIILNKDVPAFLVNRLFLRLTSECAWAVEYGEYSFEEIDSLLKYRFGMPMGIFELHDVLGGGCIDITYHALNYLNEEHGDAWKVPPVFGKLMSENRRGRKWGAGFYEWGTNDIEIKPRRWSLDHLIRVLSPVINEAAWLIENEVVADINDIEIGLIHGLNFPRGLLHFADDVGIDKIVDQLENLYKKRNEIWYKPNKILIDCVTQKKIGRSTMRGFYTYSQVMYEFVIVEKIESVGIIKLNRPHRGNAVLPTMLAELYTAVEHMIYDKNIRSIVITGTGKHFCTGADVTAFFSEEKELVNFNRLGNRLFNLIERSPKVIIAAINGAALGGGLELALSADIRVASKNAKIALPELRLGLIPGWGGAYRLVRSVGISLAKYLMLTGKTLTAEEAKQYGIIHEVFEENSFQDETLRIAKEISRGSLSAQSLLKHLCANFFGYDDNKILMDELNVYKLLSNGDPIEGIKALYYKREPKFVDSIDIKF
ncbi:MAG: enoyl-CoA hydratase-related protein [Nitrososphaerota archaeon]